MLYTNILFASDLSENNINLAQHAMTIAEQNTAKIQLLHVIQKNLYFDIADAFIKAHKILASLARDLIIPFKNIHIVVGAPELMIHTFSKKNQYDLIILGNKNNGHITNYLINHSTIDIKLLTNN